MRGLGVPDLLLRGVLAETGEDGVTMATGDDGCCSADSLDGCEQSEGGITK